MNEASVFAAALEKSSSQERAAYIAEACAGDDKLRRRVENLLRAHAEPDDLLDPAARQVGTVGFIPLAEGPGTVIGHYKLLQQIGEGGFGVVYMAEQTQPVRRMVALKIIKPGMDTAQVIARFESERQALALMDHPNIARVFDAGSTASGRPHFVMELVKGVPITDFCDKNQLPPEARLGLFLDLCHAIQHAHHKGVIHRDIKPSNVMVTLHDGVPVVKVIDFGVAKAMGLRLTERTFFTAYGQMIGTPAYMSPEQAEMSGLDVDTRSDVYALGVLLYELLTGTTPLECERLRQAAYAEMQRLIREEDAPRPSTRLSSLGGSATVLAGNRGLDVKRLVQLLAGDLDLLVMKALEKDRNRRYDTPGSLAEDIERFMHHEAILARPPSTAYKLKKFARRNRTAVITTAMIAVSLILGIVLTSWQAVRALSAERQASQAQAQAEADRDRTHKEKRRAENALADVQKEKQRAEDALADATSERHKADDLGKTALLMHLLHGAMDAEQKGAYELAEHQYRIVHEMFQTNQDAQRYVRIYRNSRNLVPITPGTEYENEMVTLLWSGFYSRRNTPEKGEVLLRKLLSFRKQHPDPNVEVAGEELRPVLQALGLNLLEQHKWADAEVVLREFLEIVERLEKWLWEKHGIGPVGWDVRSMLGQSLVGQKNYEEAERYLLEGYRIAKERTDHDKSIGVNMAFYSIVPLKAPIERLEQLYEAWEKPDEAAKWRKELQAFKR